MVTHNVALFLVIAMVVEIMILICHVILQDCLTQELCDFLARSAS